MIDEDYTITREDIRHTVFLTMNLASLPGSAETFAAFFGRCTFSPAEGKQSKTQFTNIT